MNNLPTFGNIESAKFLILYDSPNYSTYKKLQKGGSKLPQNRDNQLLLNVLDYHGYSEEDIVVSYLFPKYTRDLRGDMISGDKLNNLVKQMNPEAIITLGTFASQYLLNNSEEPLKELRKRFYWDSAYDTWILPTYAPGAIFKKSSRFRRLKNDLEKLTRLPESKEAWEDLISTQLYIYEDPDYCVKNIRWLRKNGDKLSMDIETSGFNWKTDRITELGITPSAGKSLVIPEKILNEPCVRNELAKLFDTEHLTFLWQNGKFDCKFLEYQYGFNTRQDEDTMLQHYAIDEKRGSHSLTQLSMRYLNTPDYESDFKKLVPQGGSYADAPAEARRKYLAHDTDYPYKINEILYGLMDEDEERAYRDVMIPASNTLMQVEMNGYRVDQDYLDDLDKKLAAEVNGLQSKLQTIANDVGWSVPKYRQVTGRKSPKQEEPFNPNSYPQTFYIIFNLLGLPKHQGRTSADEAARMYWLKKVLNQPGDGNFETTEEYENSDKFQKWVNDKYSNAFVYYLQKYKKVKKAHSTYVVGFKKAVWDDGRMHTTFLIHGTETGRLSSRGPNLQNIPREKVYKDMFIPSEGNVLMEVDYSQCIRKGTPVYKQGVSIENHPDAIYKGEAPIIKVIADRGYEIECTPDHEILTQRGWVEAQNLKKDDFIALEGKSVESTEIDAKYRLLGFFAGDGTFGNNSITVARGEKKYENTLKAIIKEAGFETGYWNDCSVYIKASKSFKDLAYKLVNKKNLRIPFKHLNDNELASYLSGLFEADGYADGNCIAVSTKFKTFAKDIQRALLRYGIMSTIIKSHAGYNLVEDGAINYKVSISDSVSRNNFNRVIGFISPQKKERAKNTKTRSQGNYLPTIKPEDINRLGNTNKFYRKHVMNYVNKNRYYTRGNLQGLSIDKRHTEYHWATGITVERTDKKDSVYDLMSQPRNRFNANGVIVHNCELRALAYLSQDEFLKDVYISGKDLHDAVAIDMFGEDFTKEERVKAKTINFGLAYGRTAYSIAETFDMSTQEAETLMDKWFEQKPGAEKFIKETRQSPHDGKIPTTVFGRKRRFGAITKKNAWAIENEAINFPIQSTASDLTLLSAVRLQPKLKGRAMIVNLVHDSIVLDVPKEYVAEIAKLTKETMEETPQIYLDTEIPFKADVEIGDRWGSLKEVNVNELN